MKIQVKEGVLTVWLNDKDDVKGYEECFKVQADLDYEGFFVIAANSGKALNNYHYINSIKTVDLDQ